jgi:hypothetical protein
MDYYAELVRMIAAGTQRPELYNFLAFNGLEPIEIDDLVHRAGLTLPHRPKDYSGVTPERRRQLQELSTSEE